MLWACPYTGLLVAVVHLFFFPWADRQLGMFIGPVPWLSFVQEREERGFGLAQGGDRRRSWLSHRLIALLTLSAVYKLPPIKDSCLWLAPASQGRLTQGSGFPGSHLLCANSECSFHLYFGDVFLRE